MEAPTLESVVKLAEQLSEAEKMELLRRLETMIKPYQRPSQTLRIFAVDHFPEDLTLRREDEYGDDER